MMTQRERLNNGCPLLAAISLGNFMKDVKGLLTGDTSGLLSAVTLAVGTTSAKTLKVSANVCAFAGLNAKKAEAEVAFTADDHDVADAKHSAFRISVNSSGTVKITKGADQDTAVLALANIPAVPAGEVDLGYIVVAGVFDATTTDLAATFYPATSILDAYSGIDA